MKIRLLKRLDSYILGNFIPLLMVTLPVCWFVVLMQFLYRYIDELVGKGLSLWIVAQIVFYAAMTFLPMALPLGILLASLMTFGNLAERLELLSMKASGVNLFRIMRPLFVFVLSLAVGLFTFENDFMIKSQVKLWTLLYSARRTAPELEIPEGSFYNAINGYNVFVHHRDRNTGMLKDVILYDYSKGINNVRIIRADSGRLLMNDSRNFIKWRLYSGQSFENLEQVTSNYNSDPISHIKERFRYKEVVIPFDAQFKKQDESAMQSMFVGKNLKELTAAIRESKMQIDSIRSLNVFRLGSAYNSIKYNNTPYIKEETASDIEEREKIVLNDIYKPIDIDSLIKINNLEDSLSMINTASVNMQRMLSEINSGEYNEDSYFYVYRTNVQERHRKFTFPAACIVFFLIGAPLGAIIRKGGIGMPMITCVLLFIVYYVIDTMGYKLSNSQSIPFWLGSWLSVFTLLPLGIFLTITAARDSASLNLEAWGVFLKRLLGFSRVRNIEYKGVIIEETPTEYILNNAEALRQRLKKLQELPIMRNSIIMLWLKGSSSDTLNSIEVDLENWVEKSTNSTNALFISKLKDLPFLPTRVVKIIPKNKVLSRIFAVLLPLSIPITLFEMRHRREVRKTISSTISVLSECIDILLDREDKFINNNI